MTPLHRRYSRGLLTATLLASTMLGCAAGDDNTGVGGVLVVSQVEIVGGDGVVLAGGTLQVQATPRTSTGLPVPGKTVVWASGNASLATVSGTGLVTGVAVGTTSITATVDGVVGRIDVHVRPVPVAAVQITANVSTLETGETTQLQAATLDSVGGALGGRPVAWSSSNSLVATVSPGGLVTAVAAGTATITATSEGRSGAVTLTVTPRPASRLGFITQPSNGTAGVAMTPAIQVALQDEAGSTVPNTTGTITLTLASNPGGATLTGVLSAQAVQGIATFSDVRVNRTGQGYTLRATAQGFTDAVSGAFAVSAGPPASLVVAVEPTGGSATGAAFAQQPVIQLRDAHGNDAPRAGVTVTAVLASGPGTLNGTTSVVTGSDGRAVFTNLAIIGSTGTYSLQFTAIGLTPTTSSPFNLGAGLATQLTFTTAPPGTAINGQPLATTVVVQLRDGAGNPVPQAGTVVTAAIQSGTGALGGTVAVATGSTGAASFPGLVITGIVGNFTLRFSAPGVTPAVSNTIVLQPGAATQLTFTTAPPATATNGVDLTPPVVVQLRDVGGNAVSTAGVDVVAAIQAGPAGVLSGTTTVPTDAAGSATFSTLRITGPVGAYALEFTSGSLTNATSNGITLEPGPATKLAFETATPASAQSGVALSPAPVVQLQDVSNNNVSEAGVTVTASRFSGDPSVVIGGGSITTDAQGRATFSSLTLTGPAGPYEVGFASPPLVGVLSPPITIEAAPAAKLGFVTTPSTTATNGQALTQQPVLQLLDAANTPVAEAGWDITVSLTGGGTLDVADLTVTTDAAGQAVFAGVTITGLVGPRTLEFSTATLPTLSSGAIDLVAGPATALAMVTQPPTATTSGASLAPAPSVRLVDMSGNAVAALGTDVLVAVSPAGTLGGTTTVATDASGLATFPGLSITGAVGDYQLDFSAASLSGVSSTPISLVAASGVSISTQPSATVRNDLAFGVQPAVQLVDATNAPVAIAGVSVSAEIATGGGTLLGTVNAITGGSGAATFTDLRILGLVGVRTLRFLASGLAPDTSSDVLVTAGLASAVAMVTEPAATTVDAQPLPLDPMVRLEDVSGNAVDSINVSIAVAVTPAGATLGGTASRLTVSGGTATFAGLSLTGAAGDYQLDFSSPGLGGVQSSTIGLLVPTGIVVSTQPSDAATRNVLLPQQPAVTVTDAGAAGVPGVTVTVTVLTDSGPAGTLGGTTVQSTGAGGIAAWSDLVISKPNSGAGQYRLRFTTTNGLTIDSNPIAIP